MSSRGVHDQTATANFALSRSLANEPGWFVTVLYYAAIQTLEARLADKNEHPVTPDQRRTACLSISPAVGAPWRSLKQLSEQWRYNGIVPSPDECLKAERWAADMAAAMGEKWPR